MGQRMRHLIWPAIATAVGLAILLSLGGWQLQRLQWKETLIARVEEGLDAPPVAAPGPEAWPQMDLGDWEYRPVTVAGRLMPDATAYANVTLTEPRGRYGGFGFFAMTPVRTTGRWFVYVNRGFVPGDRRDAAMTVGVEGEVTVTGLLRRPRQRSWFMPSDDRADNQWFSRDPALYAEAAGLRLDEVAPYYIDAAFNPNLPEGLPQGGETNVVFRNNHLQYALTWFGLAAGLVAVFVVFARSRLRDRGSGRPQA